jgi:hypothetical protein
LHAYFPELQIFDRVNLPELLPIRKRMGQLKNFNLLNITVLFIFQLLSELKCSQKQAENGLKTDRTSGPNASNQLLIANFGLRFEAQKAECLNSRRSLPRTPIRGGNDGGGVRSAGGELENRRTGEPENRRTGELENRPTATMPANRPPRARLLYCRASLKGARDSTTMARLRLIIRMRSAVVKHPLPRVKRVVYPLAAVLLSTLMALLAAEIFLRLDGTDWDLIARLLYYQNADRAVHQPVYNAEWLYRLRPNAMSADGAVHVNSLGYRGAPRQAAKPPGVYRIVVLGGSNVYGISLADDYTWPAFLERELNRRFNGTFEVWNGGVPAYVGCQMARVGQEALAKYAPDLFVLGLSNLGAPAFLPGIPPRTMFRRLPELWRGLFYGDYPGTPGRPAVRYWLLAHSATYRLYELGLMTYAGDRWSSNVRFEWRNVARLRDLADAARQRGVKVCYFVYPGERVELFRAYYRDSDVPVMTYPRQELPLEYLDIHPPAHAADWYAGPLAAFLADQGLLGPVTMRPPAAGDAVPRIEPDPEDEETLEGSVRLTAVEAYIPGGSYVAGCSLGQSDCFDNERPRHRVTLSPFWIDRTEVTNADYRRCVDAGRCAPPVWPNGLRYQPDDHPVVGVSFHQAEAYCRAQGKRLPTELEWEFAARAGTEAPVDGDPAEIAWFAENSGGGTHPVAARRANAWGLYDTLGNVREWCANVYCLHHDDANCLTAGPNADVLVPRTVRGGGWFTARKYLRLSYRSGGSKPTAGDKDLGFRCVR